MYNKKWGKKKEKKQQMEKTKNKTIERKHTKKICTTKYLGT